MTDLTAIALYLAVIVALALFVGWEYERSRRLNSRRASFFDRSDGGME
jgi:hypothetical protein